MNPCAGAVRLCTLERSGRRGGRRRVRGCGKALGAGFSIQIVLFVYLRNVVRGHLGEGVLEFAPVSGSPDYVELRIRDVGGPEVRTFRWQMR